MTRPNCFDQAVVCPDIICPRCIKPYQTWIWKDNLLFTCPDCNELGFSIEGMDLNEKNLPRESFFTEIEWPCKEKPDPTCTESKKMLFIENYERLKFLEGEFKGSTTSNNYSVMQRMIGEAYESIVNKITN
jgi:hypothetical protein